jgi:hypothetical protein
MDVVKSFLRNHFVEVYSAVLDLRSDRLAAELSARLRPHLFTNAEGAPDLPVGKNPAHPHPIGFPPLSSPHPLPTPGKHATTPQPAQLPTPTLN